MGPWGYIGLAYALTAIILAGYWWGLGMRIRKRQARLGRGTAGRVEAVT